MQIDSSKGAQFKRFFGDVDHLYFNYKFRSTSLPDGNLCLMSAKRKAFILFTAISVAPFISPYLLLILVFEIVYLRIAQAL